MYIVIATKVPDSTGLGILKDLCSLYSHNGGQEAVAAAKEPARLLSTEELHLCMGALLCRLCEFVMRETA